MGVVAFFCFVIDLAEKGDTIPGFRAFTNANNLVMTSNTSGNNPRAKKLATEFLDEYVELQKKYFSKPGIQKKNINVYCRLDEREGNDTIIFLVQSLDYLRLDKKGRKVICVGSWLTACTVLKDSDFKASDTTLVVGVKSGINYKRVMVGQPATAHERSPLLGVKEDYEENDVEDKLYPFFITDEAKLK